MKRAIAMALLLAMPLAAQTTATLSSGTGPGTVSVTVDGMGSYGGCFTSVGLSDLTFDDGASAAPVPTTCGSALLFHEVGVGTPIALVSYTTGGISAALPQPPVTVNVPNRDVQASWTVGNFDWTCRQQLFGPDPASGPVVEGSTLVQTYTVTNSDPSFATHVLDFCRWVDADVGAGTQYQFNLCGMTATEATAGTQGPFLPNGHATFQYDPLYPFVTMQSMEVITDSGLPREPDRYETFVNTGGAAWNTIGATAASGLTNLVGGDANGDLLTDAPIDCASAVGVTQVTLQPTLSTTIICRTRLTRLDSTSTIPVEIQARDLTRRAFGGSHPLAFTAPLLCVNGQGGVVQVSPSSPISLSMAEPAGTTGGVYLIHAVLGNPVSGSLCAAPRTLDFSFWGAPLAFLGVGAFPAEIPAFGITATGGGGAASGVLLSNLPGFAPITGLPASNTVPCGGPILPPFYASNSAVVTLQSLQTDTASATGLSVSNAVTLVLGGCPVPVR